MEPFSLRRIRNWQSTEIFILVSKIAAIIFFVEFLIMQAFDAWMPVLRGPTEGVLDALLLTFIASPLIYWLVAMPFVHSARSANNQLKNKLHESDRLLSHNIELQQSLREASDGIAITHEQTLQRVGADLHDGPTQQLTYVLLRLDALAGAPALANDELKRIRSVLADTMHELRSVCMELSLPQLDMLSTKEVVLLAIERHKNVDGQPVQLTVDASAVELPEPRKICVYRIVQEALANARKHSAASSVAVTVRDDPTNQAIYLEISDNGKGFDPTKTKHGLGLSGMRARVHALSGLFQITRSETGGTKIVAVI